MLAVGPLGPQYHWLFAWYELGRQAQLGRRHPPYPEGAQEGEEEVDRGGEEHTGG